jgi:hypothetical protein
MCVAGGGLKLVGHHHQQSAAGGNEGEAHAPAVCAGQAKTLQPRIHDGGAVVGKQALNNGHDAPTQNQLT